MALELTVGDGADAVPPEPPTPPPTIAPVFDGSKDDVDELELELEKDEDCVWEVVVALPVLDEANEPVRLLEVTDNVEEASLVCDEPELVEVTKVPFALVTKVDRSKAPVAEDVELGLASRNLARD